MEVINNASGIGGLLTSFRELVKDSKKVMFIGTTGFCTPFAELMAYVIRDASIEVGFIPDIRHHEAKAIISTPSGMQIGDDIDYHADTVVLLGGLAMPKMKIDVETIKQNLDDILEGAENTNVIGICFQSMFDTQCWIGPINFDYIIDSDLSASTIKL
ncbi:DUF2124 domain-containing protein [Methanococcoides orientis]|uniref:DUF2124 domain-containing protein n=1 Tax=Methanococcoides orientis TaxID=2822137 RepID=UPI001E294BE3|nr:DUF2124 domain-containing protein [Methanococcoides orientis]UGV41143.1 DUF2124 domain-containing protein [Methanococcoides orientis]